MAKKANTKKVEVEPQIETMEEVVTEFFEETVVAEPKARERLKPSNEWEIKNRMYLFEKVVKNHYLDLLKQLGIYYFDEEKGYERELKYCQNQKTRL
jgi:hypothetical protein